VRILYAVQNHQELRLRRDVLQLRVLLRRSERNHPLMRFGAGQPVESAPVFEPHGRAGLAGQIHHFLDARTRQTSGDQDAFEGPLRAQGFDDRVDSDKNGQIRLWRVPAEGWWPAWAHCAATRDSLRGLAQAQPDRLRLSRSPLRYPKCKERTEVSNGTA